MNNTFSIHEFVESLFSQNPKSPCSTKLQITDDTKKIETLMSILVGGAKYLYGPNIRPEFLSVKQFDFLQSYFNSFGFVIRFKKHFLDSENKYLLKIDIWFDELKRQTTCDGRTLIV